MMNSADYDRLRKLMEMLASPSDGEILNAVGAISRILNANGLTWTDILLPRKLMPVQANATEASAIDEAEMGPKPFESATNRDMYIALMNSPLVSHEIKRDIKRYQEAIDGNRVTPRIRADLQAMYKYAILDGRPV